MMVAGPGALRGEQPGGCLAQPAARARDDDDPGRDTAPRDSFPRFVGGSRGSQSLPLPVIVPPMGLDETISPLGCRGPGPHGIFSVQRELIVPFQGEWAA